MTNPGVPSFANRASSAESRARTKTEDGVDTASTPSALAPQNAACIGGPLIGESGGSGAAVPFRRASAREEPNAGAGGRYRKESSGAAEAGGIGRERLFIGRDGADGEGAEGAGARATECIWCS